MLAMTERKDLVRVTGPGTFATARPRVVRFGQLDLEQRMQCGVQAVVGLYGSREGMETAHWLVATNGPELEQLKDWHRKCLEQLGG